MQRHLTGKRFRRCHKRCLQGHLPESLTPNKLLISSITERVSRLPNEKLLLKRNCITCIPSRIRELISSPPSTSSIQLMAAMSIYRRVLCPIQWNCRQQRIQSQRNRRVLPIVRILLMRTRTSSTRCSNFSILLSMLSLRRYWRFLMMERSSWIRTVNRGSKNNWISREIPF